MAARPSGSCAIKTTRITSPESHNGPSAATSYLAWRTQHSFTSTFEAMLTRPFVIHYYGIAYFGEGIAARQNIQR